MLQIDVILPAAGLSRRFAEDSAGQTNKLEADLAGKPVLMRAVELFVGRADVGQVIVAANPDALDEFRLRWGDRLGFLGAKIVAGGRVERWETVCNALRAVDDGCTHVAVHDAARPLTPAALIDRVFEAAARHDAVIPALPIAGTVKRVVSIQTPDNADTDPADAILDIKPRSALRVSRVVQTVDRTGLVEVQTPQVFEVGLLRRAYAQVTEGKIDPAGITDDAGLIELINEPVHVVEGNPRNFKITRSADLELAGLITTNEAQARAASLGAKRLFLDDDDD